MSKELDGRIALVKNWYDIRPAMSSIRPEELTGIPPGELRTYVPQWSSDLNLMHELVAELDIKQYERYVNSLEGVSDLADDDGNIYCDMLRLVTEATADQKATAWLAVMEG